MIRLLIIAAIVFTIWDFAKYKYKEDFAMVAHVHDEMQLQVREDLADKVGQLGVQSVKETQNVFGLRCPLDAEYKVGNNWAETH